MQKEIKRPLHSTSVLVAFILIVGIFFSVSATSQEKSVELSNGQSEYDQLLVEKKIRQISRDERYDEAWIKLREGEFAHRMDVFYFQYWTSLGIFLVVVMLVIGGFILSWKQFELDAQLGTSGSENAFEISKSGVKFRSSVIGLSILFLSLGFFYMYIKEVYPVNIV